MQVTKPLPKVLILHTGKKVAQLLRKTGSFGWWTLVKRPQYLSASSAHSEFCLLNVGERTLRKPTRGDMRLLTQGSSAEQVVPWAWTLTSALTRTGRVCTCGRAREAPTKRACRYHFFCCQPPSSYLTFCGLSQTLVALTCLH